MSIRLAGITLAACIVVAVGFIARFAYEQQAVAQDTTSSPGTTELTDDPLVTGLQEDTGLDDDSASDNQYDSGQQERTDDSVTTTQYYEDENLLESSGDISGPLPFMSDGGCPEEFPVIGADGCYPAS